MPNSLKDHPVFYNPTCTDDCVHCGHEEGLYDNMVKFNEFWCKKKGMLVHVPNKAERILNNSRFCYDHASATLTKRRSQEGPQAAVPTADFMRRLEELMLGYAFDNVSGEITFHSAYSNVADITIKLGPAPKNPHTHLCNYCLKEVAMVGDMVDDDKLYCPHCKRHTAPEFYNDEV